MRRSFLARNTAAFYEFVDNSFLNNKRPPVPGGAWPVESLRGKSLSDLQQIWLLLVKERNMLLSTKEHYLRHQEELGAMPAPSRLTMIQTSMRRVRQVVRERDAAATAAAQAEFNARLKRGVYRHPPGPPPPPGAHDHTSCVKITLARRVEADRLRELFGRFDVFESHKGIVRVELRLPDDVLRRKEEAEQLWVQYTAQRSDVENYHKWAAQPSAYDYAHVELAPGVFANDSVVAKTDPMNVEEGEEETKKEGKSEKKEEKQEKGEKEKEEEWEKNGAIIAARLPVPPPAQSAPPPRSPLEQLRAERRSFLARSVVQLGYFPNITLTPPMHNSAAAVPRPTHPDEIEGPWEAFLTYDSPDGVAYAQSLQIESIDGAAVLRVEADDSREPEPYARVDKGFCEAMRREKASEETLMQWPHVPEWKYEYSTFTRKSVAEIVQHNYSNVVDYVDREVLLTGRSVWECPIDIDYTCGGMKSVPAHAKKPKRYMESGIAAVGVTDI